jgi:hypothetical protein
MKALVLAAVLLAFGAGQAEAGGIDEALAGTRWGETSLDLLHLLGDRATALPRPLDFGDSYVEVVQRDVPVGGTALIAYYQMDKAGQGLKRIQLERPRHAVNPPAFRAVLDGLEQAYGAADVMCGIRAVPAAGFQRAAEYVWTRGGIVIRAIFRDTTLEAFEGCFSGPCGLTGQLLVRASPPSEDSATCQRASPSRGQG